MISGIVISLPVLVGSVESWDCNFSFSLALFIFAKLGNLSNSCSSCSKILFILIFPKSLSAGLSVDFLGEFFFASEVLINCFPPKDYPTFKIFSSFKFAMVLNPSLTYVPSNLIPIIYSSINI